MGNTGPFLQMGAIFQRPKKFAENWKRNTNIHEVYRRTLLPKLNDLVWKGGTRPLGRYWKRRWNHRQLKMIVSDKLNAQITSTITLIVYRRANDRKSKKAFTKHPQVEERPTHSIWKLLSDLKMEKLRGVHGHWERLICSKCNSSIQVGSLSPTSI